MVDDPVSGPPDADQYTMGHYTRVLRRHLVLVVGFVIVGAVLGVAGASAIPLSYTSVSGVKVHADVADQGSVNSTSGRTVGTINMDTEVQIAGSSAVADLARTALHSHASIASMQSHLTVTVPANTTVLSLAYSAHSASAAQAGAAAFAKAYLDQRKATSQAELAGQTSEVQTQLAAQEKTLSAEIKDVGAALAGSTDKGIAQSKESLTRQTIASLNTQLTALQTEFPNPGQVISAATKGKTGTPIRIVAVIVGLALGLLIGLIAPFVRERLGRKVRHGDDLRRLGVRVLAEADAKPRRRMHIFRTKKSGRGNRAAQHAAAAVIRGIDKQGGTVLFAGLGDARSLREALAATATELTHLGQSVAVIRPDLSVEPDDGSAQHSRRSVNTTEYLGWPAEAQGDEDGTDLGNRDEGPVANVRATVDVARRVNSYVLLDGSEAAEGSAAFMLAAVSDAVVLIVQPRFATRSNLALLVDQLTVTGRPLLGGILWAARKGSTAATRPPVPHDKATVKPTTSSEPKKTSSGLAKAQSVGSKPAPNQPASRPARASRRSGTDARR
jgi:capsular polysaccharide biosynthesis protein